MEHNFSMKQKILNLCLRWRILKSYRFVAEVTFNQLMIEIFKCLKGISPPIMNEIFRLRNIPYTERNPRNLDSRLPKTVYCGLETIAYKGPQLWQQLPEKTT